ncbi:hypothetical protein [Puia sp.]|uniref:hypothetical protein n=1 Tax=Puia sp. TaxID=2045100 RepID=UPI002F411C1C
MLSTLGILLREQTALVELFLRQTEKQRVINPFQYAGEPVIGDSITDELWEASGMRRIVLNEANFGSSLTSLSALISNCSLIEFVDWAVTGNVSDSWDCLYSKVIKPSGKRDFRFIFHLGDIAVKPVFEVDEVLDIIGDYSSYGRVTLILDNTEADHLWCRLNGRDPRAFTPGLGTPPPGTRYKSLFNTMRIDSMIVLFPAFAVHFSRAGLFDLESHSPGGLLRRANDRRSFSIGYQLGLLLRLDVFSCAALGLAYTGSDPGPTFSDPVSSVLIDFIQHWSNSLY